MNINYFKNIANSDISINMSDEIGIDFSFFQGDEAKKIQTVEASPVTKKRSKPKVAIDGNVLAEKEMNPIPGAVVIDADYARSYSDTNNLIIGTIAQADELNNEIKTDIDAIRASKTIKNKYTYITNLTASASALLNTKLSGIKELNSTITQGHNLELNRMKTLKLNESNESNDDMRMMDIYSAFVNTPIGSYNPNQLPNMQDLTVGVNGVNSNVNGIEIVTNGANNPLTPEQQRMRMETNPNIETVVRFDQSSGQRIFDIIDKTTGMSVPNVPRPDSFLLEDTTIDIHTKIARNRNINMVWPLILEGSGSMNEY